MPLFEDDFDAETTPQPIISNSINYKGYLVRWLPFEIDESLDPATLQGCGVRDGIELLVCTYQDLLKEKVAKSIINSDNYTLSKELAKLLTNVATRTCRYHNRQ